MLEARDITYSVGDKALVSGASVSFAPGRLHLMIGPNGAGKSTLIKILARLLRPQAGEVRYEGADVRDASEAELAKRRAVLSQAVEIAFPLSVREVVMMGRYPHFGGRPGPVDERVADEMMRFFDVTEFAERDYRTLSGGERQRVNFARVLAQLWPAHDASPHSDADARAGDDAPPASAASPPRAPCRYLFLDEPLTFLDIRHQIEFMKKVRAFADAPDVVTVGVVHDLNLAARFADQIVLIDRARVVAAGSPTQVLTAERIREVFGVEPTFVPVGHAGPHIIFD